MAVNVTLDDLFARLGRMHMEIVELNKEMAILQARLSETAAVAGNALRALESLGHKETAASIVKGEYNGTFETVVGKSATQENPS